jgi:hypothetical protein
MEARQCVRQSRDVHDRYLSRQTVMDTWATADSLTRTHKEVRT